MTCLPYSQNCIDTISNTVKVKALSDIRLNLSAESNLSEVETKLYCLYNEAFHGLINFVQINNSVENVLPIYYS